MSDSRKTPTTRDLVVFGTALVAIPTFALSFLIYDVVTNPRHALWVVIVPALVGAAVGASFIAIRRLRTSRIREGGRGERFGFVAISIAAIIGVIGNDLPRWVDGSMAGWAVGFFIALDIFLWRLWRTDPKFRSRIVASRASPVDSD